jgi:transcriptional regulator with XRE-family HTH domain
MRLLLKAAILSSGRTQAAIGLLAQVTETRLSAIARSRADPTAEECERLAQVLGVPADSLFGEPTSSALAQAARLESVEKTA